MEKKYFAVEIDSNIYVLNNTDELGGLLDNEVQFSVIGQVCTNECDTTCNHYREGTCPCKALKDVRGNRIYVFVNSDQ